MKYTLLLLFFFYGSLAMAQSDTTRTIVKTTTSKTMTMKGSELQKMIGNVTDKNIYDEDWNIVDSATAVKMLYTFEYQQGLSKKKGEPDFKRTIRKIDPVRQAIIDSATKAMKGPASPALQEGSELNLKPLSKKIKLDELKGKALVLIFWCNCYGGSAVDANEKVNYVLSTYKDPSKLEIIAITHHSFDEAAEALKKNPIVNTRHIYDVPDITAAYRTGNRPVIVVTDKSHKITYSMSDQAEMTPRTLYKLLKEL
ncbi:MAG: hypothetical protein V4594_11015 [Bacteroidota bacterium]